ncbi:1,3-1,4-beta-glycanase [Phyllobacterium phragmitis]|uniref:1,3-1,4-beta-glycanase n=1 Tax=Phyllobacterium phragmitis TaxID=2670329 RepID=A0A2S9ITE1_9HYPH|nr:1,3-1,4-beta-glycanase [Phyllobacterium phragmitis]
MGTVVNAKGVELSYSGTPIHHFSATDSGPELYGTAENDALWGDSSVYVTMLGGEGDDIYHLYSSRNKAFEAAGEGVDTIDTWMSYRLPDNFENLIVTGSDRYAFGNDGHNIITGGSGRQTIDGGAGDDVLIGGADNDVFALTEGDGSDLILDFEAGDTARLTGYGFTSFAEIQARMSQTGDDVRVDMGDGESLVFAGTTIAELDSSQFKYGLDKSGMSLSFADDFDTLDMSDGESGTWHSNYWWGGENGNTLHGNGELQWYIDVNYEPTSSVNPFSVENGVLTITAAQTPDDIKPYINDYDYMSGMLTTHKSFAQTYGYFEMRADLPETQGLWPAFWLLPESGAWPPELDVVEMIGQQPNTLQLTAHSDASGEHTQDGSTVYVADTEGFHTYGVLWTPETLTWYVDGTEVASTDTPDDMHEPMYMIANLAVGGLAGTPADGLTTPGEMKIDYIRAYSLDSLVQASASTLIDTSETALAATDSTVSSTAQTASMTENRQTDIPVFISQSTYAETVGGTDASEVGTAGYGSSAEAQYSAADAADFGAGAGTLDVPGDYWFDPEPIGTLV